MVHEHPPYNRYERVYLVLAGTFVTLLVLTNIVGTKLFSSPLNPEWALTTGILTYPFTFLATDIVSEVYGKKRADFMVVVGFCMSMLMLLILQMAMRVPPHPAWVTDMGFFADGWRAGADMPEQTGLQGYQHAFESVFAVNGILLFGSMLAYATAQLTDNFLFHSLKRLTHGKYLWLRNNASTWVSQLVDTLIVNSILFYLGFGMELMLGLQIMMVIYLHKVIIAALDTPLVYLGVYLVRKAVGEEAEPALSAGQEA